MLSFIIFFYRSDLDKEISRLKSEGVRVLAYINAHFSAAGPIFKEAENLGYFVKNSTGQTYVQDFGEFSCGTVDLTNPAAYNWLKGNTGFFEYENCQSSCPCQTTTQHHLVHLYCCPQI